MSCSRFDAVWIGRPSLRSAFTSSSRPVSIASTRRSRENQWRILVRARGVCANCSQSRLGPAPFDLAGEDLHGVAGGEGRVEGHEPAVDPRADAAVPDLGVDRVGEVDRVGPGRHRHDPALRGEDEDLVLLEVDLQRLHELGRVLGLLLPVHEALEPDEVVGLGRARRAPCSPSARRCRTRPAGASPVVRICTSTRRPPGPMTVVCSAW